MSVFQQVSELIQRSMMLLVLLFQHLGSRVNGLNQAIRNTNDGISVVQIAEGALDEVTTILQRMRDIAVQAANDSLGSNERLISRQSRKACTLLLDDVTGAAKFGSTSLLDGTFASGKSFQIGAEDGDVLSVSIGISDPATLTVADDVTDIHRSKRIGSDL